MELDKPKQSAYNNYHEESDEETSTSVACFQREIPRLRESNTKQSEDHL
ncbi:MAG: hypothetical protein Q4D90_07105 [bacterium]|nr:hypothetical protein [bacterium]